MASAPVDRSLISIPLTGAVVVFASIAAGFGNVMYLGLPVITEMLGEQYGYVAVLYDLLASTPILLTIGVFIAARYGSGAPVSAGASLKRVFLLPPLWGVAAGITVRLAGVMVPQPVLERLPAETVENARWWERHLIEVITGCRRTARPALVPAR